MENTSHTKSDESKALNKLKNNIDQKASSVSPQNNNSGDSSFAASEDVNENQEENQPNRDGNKDVSMKDVADSNVPETQENATGISMKSDDGSDDKTNLNSNIPKESEMESNETSRNNPESAIDIKMPLKEHESSESYTESQESQTKSSHNHSETTSIDATLIPQTDTTQSEPNPIIPHSTGENQYEVNQSDPNVNNASNECNKEQLSSQDAFDKAESGDVTDSNANIETENQECGLEKQIHEGIKTCEDNLESQTNSVTSDKMGESINSQFTHSTNKTENTNETMITDNDLTPSIDTNVQNNSEFSSNAEDICKNNAETNFIDQELNDNRTNNGDVTSDASDLNPSAMTVSDEKAKEEEMKSEPVDQQPDPNMTYGKTKPSSPNTQQNNASPSPSSELPASNNEDTANRLKDDPYNFSEEEDVFSPQLPSRQFSSNANTAGSDSNDAALERLKEEHR